MNHKVSLPCILRRGKLIRRAVAMMVMLMVMPAVLTVSPVLGSAESFAETPVETLAGNGQMQVTNTEGVREFVTRLYNECLGREPEAEGLEAWTQRLESGEMSGAQVAQGFMFSQEMANRYLSTGNFVEVLYKAMLGRASDTEGKVAWVSRIGGGMSLHSAFEGFVSSAEFKAICDRYGVVAGGVLTPVTMPAPNIPKPPAAGEINPLTGEPLVRDIRNNRPWSVTLGCTTTALPLHGIGMADIICEFPIESGETRFLAIYQDIADVEVIAGVRSLRTSSMEIARGFDSIFAHWLGRTNDNVVTGGNPITAYETFNAEAVGGRHPDRPGTHDAYVTGKMLIENLPAGFRTLREPETFHEFTFADDGTPPKGLPAQSVSVSFSANTRWKKDFTYNEADGKYYATHYGKDLIDALDGNPLSFTNIIVLKTGMRFNINGPGHTYIRTAGGDEGYFICGGKYTEIYWARDARPSESPFQFFLKDGTPLTFGVGKSFICFTHDTQEPVFG